MIRVGFVLTFDATGWLGGVSYFRNLLSALASLPKPRIAPVVFAGQRTDSGVLAQFPSVQLVRSSLLDSGSVPWLLRRAVAKVLGRDVGLELLLKRHQVHALSHQGFLGGLGHIPILGWIPDFQECHLPEFFSPEEIAARTRKRCLFCRACSVVILSSRDATEDLERLDGSCAKHAKTLQFVADVAMPAQLDVMDVLRRLGVEPPYFHLPNQFWRHKNHGVVVEALRVLKARGVMARVVASGNTADHRQPGYFQALMRQAEEAGVKDRFLSVGTVPYADLVALMAGSVAVINPSRFEGWSTTVEEAKSLGKTVVLSDLRVHREQAPPRGQYFAPDDVDGLATAMENTLREYDPLVDRTRMREAQEALPNRRQTFARTFEDIVVEAVP
ncbi:MAG: Glycosyltransferase involved in cell wall biosynthesis [Nitrospira sp.]|nr:MAG: Glycosyltransferase involved in cell wall biosynthesis [Nitrospira sp.]